MLVPEYLLCSSKNRFQLFTVAYKHAKTIRRDSPTHCDCEAGNHPKKRQDRYDSPYLIFNQGRKLSTATA